MLEEDDVVVGARRGDRVEDALQGVLLIVGVEHDVEDADIIRF
jgi:short-subunit dehydrogenase involved in D-alanine esterification of teichoic acids